MDHERKVADAARWIKERWDTVPRAAVVLGSGLGAIADAVASPTVIECADIPHWPRLTAAGHSGRLVCGELDGVPVIVLQGRVHLYEGRSMDEVTFPTRVAGELGADVYLATNASGGINESFSSGDLVAVTDHINLMGTNPLIGPNVDRWGERFPDMTEAYDKGCLRMLDAAAAESGVPLKHGVYIAFTGPSYETPAEIRMARTLGADVVGMSTVPEIIAAGHMGMRAAAVSCVSNSAAGITGEKLTHEEVLTNMARAAGSLTSLVLAFARQLAREVR